MSSRVLEIDFHAERVADAAEREVQRPHEPRVFRVGILEEILTYRT